MKKDLSRLVLPLVAVLVSVSMSVAAMAQSQPWPGPSGAQSASVNTPAGAMNPGTAGTFVPGDNYFRLQRKICRWSDKTKFVLVYISTAEHLPDWKPWNVQIVKDAFAEWQRALDNRLIFVFLNEPSQADVVVQWWNTSTPQVEKGASGLNSYQTWGKYIAKNDVFISLHHDTGEARDSSMLYATALHELGHMIGIREHSDNPNDMMYFRTTDRLHLSQRDINTMKMIYAAKPDYTNPPGYHLSNFKDFQKTQKGGGWWIPVIIPIPL